MAHKNMILDILEENDIAELFVEDATTVLEMEDWIACPRNPDNTKEQMIPLMSITKWLTYLEDLEDVVEIVSETSGMGSGRGTGKDLRVSLVLKMNGALKNPKKDFEFDSVFDPIKKTLLKLLAQRLSYTSYLKALEAPSDEASPGLSDDVSKDSESVEVEDPDESPFDDMELENSLGIEHELATDAMV